MTRRLLIATRSHGKLRELRELFASTGFDLLDLGEAGLEERAEEDDLEVHDTFEANALAKAQYFHARSGLPVVADDSGLEVFALGGAPGVRSKRWSGRADLGGRDLDAANNALLLETLGDATDRRARYVCAVAYVDEAGAVVRRGEVAGRIESSPSGSNGFGYDPYFHAFELGRTFGEASAAEKHAVSHRARAFAALRMALETERGAGG